MLRSQLTSLSEYFGREADRHRRKARIWFGLALLFGVGAVIAFVDLVRYLVVVFGAEVYVPLDQPMDPEG